MAGHTVLLSTRLGQLMPSHLTKLSLMLDPDNSWKGLASDITNRHGLPMFTNDQIINIEYQKAHRSPTKEVIMMWNTDNPTVADLLSALMAIRHYRAAKYVHEDILKRTSPLQIPKDQALQQNYPNVNNDKSPGNESTDHRNDHQCTQVPSANPNPPIVNIDTAIRSRTVMDNDSSLTPCKPIASSDDSTTLTKQPVSLSTNYRDDRSEPCSPLNDVPTSPINDVVYPMLRDIEGVYRFTGDFLQRITGNFNADPVIEGGHFLGEGGFAQVYKGLDECYPPMAVKRINKNVLNDHQEITQKQFNNEIETLAKCCHDNILRLIGFCDDDYWCLVYEFMPNGTLEDRLACKNGTAPLSIPQRLSIVQGVAHGLHYLHHRDPPLIHRDIKSANILLTETLTAKIGDCGTVRRGPAHDRHSVTHVMTQQVLGTQAYMSREYLENGEVSAKLDAFSYGVMLLEVITGLPIYDEKREERLLPTHVFEYVEQDEDVLELSDVGCGPWPRSLVLAMYAVSVQLRHNKRKRATVSQKLAEIESWTADRSESRC